MRASSFFLGLLLLAFFAGNSIAQTGAGCKRCHLPYQWKADGAGFARDHLGLCPDCEKLKEYKDQWHLWFFGELNENRYLVFENGVIIDLKHYRGSMILSHYLNYLLPDVVLGGLEGAVAAYGVGWGIEKLQEHNGHYSGHPNWTNEDMLSNTMGVVFGQTGYVFGISEWTWNKQSITFLESFFGPIQKVTDKDPNKTHHGK